MTLRQEIRELLGSDAVLSPRMVRLLQDLRDEWAELDRRIKAYDEELLQTRRLTSIPGIRVINATALVAAIGDASAFARRHDLAACLGLTSPPALDRGKTKMLGICKRSILTNIAHPRRTGGAWSLREPAIGRWHVDFKACKAGLIQISSS